MRKMSIVSAALACSALVALAGAVVGRAEEKVKAGESVHVYNDPSYASEYGVVTFSHLAHKKIFGQEKLDCKPCHMAKPPLFSMKKPKPGEAHVVMKMSEMREGKFCGGCHNGKTTINGNTAFDVASEDNCGKCHKKES